MTELQDIEESIRYSCRHNPMYGEDLIKKIQRSFTITEKVDSMIQYLKDEIKRTKIKEYEQLCRQELAIYENILKSYTKLSNEIQSKNGVKND